MRSRAATWSIIVTTAMLLASLVVPAWAGAAPALTASSAGPTITKAAVSPAAAKAAATERLRLTIAEVLRVRALSFGATAGSLTQRINSVGAIATRLQRAGGNVKPARAHIAAAKRHLSKARSLEKQTIARFKAVISASNRPAAFSAARGRGKLATAQLKMAQADIRAATTDLRKVVRRLQTK
jgi:hypothetical protein